MEPATGAARQVSGIDQWTEDLQKYGGLENLKNVFTEQIPYTVFKAAVAPMQSDWTRWQLAVQQVTKKSFAKPDEFITELATKKTYRLSHLTDIAKRVKGALEALQATLTSFKPIMARVRVACDKDTSKGHMKDIHPLTLQELARVINATKKDFRLLACALGFDSIQCRQCTHPSEMLKRWSEQNNEATVERLFFEARLLEMDTVCAFLETIDLEGTSDVTFEAPSLEELLSRRVTVFDVQRINGMLQDIDPNGAVNMFWEQVCQAFAVCKSYGKELNTQKFMASGCTDYPLWGSYRISLGELMALLQQQTDPTIKQVSEKFMRELRMGLWEQKNQKGVTYSQIAYLVKVLNDFEVACKNIQSPPQDVSKAGPWIAQPVPFDIPEFDRELFGIYYYHDPAVTLEQLVFLFWQQQANRDMPLETFVDRLTQALNKNRGFMSKEFAQVLQNAYNGMKPYRRHVEMNLPLDDLHISPPKQNLPLSEHLLRKVTPFDIELLYNLAEKNNIFLDWVAVTEKLPAVQRIMRSNPHSGLEEAKIALVKVTCGELLDAFEKADRHSRIVVPQFKEEIEKGNHESIRSSDITFSLIAPLCKEIKSEEINSEQLQAELSRKLNWPEGLNADEFLLLYWHQNLHLSFEDLRKQLWGIFSSNSGKGATKLAAHFAPNLALPALASAQLRKDEGNPGNPQFPQSFSPPILPRMSKQEG